MPYLFVYLINHRMYLQQIIKRAVIQTETTKFLDKLTSVKSEFEEKLT